MEYEYDSVKHFEKISNNISDDIQSRSRESNQQSSSALGKENMDIYTGSTYFRLLLFLLTMMLICVSLLSGPTEVVYVDDVTAVRTYVIKNSSKHAEDKALTTDPDLITDYDQPGAFWLPSQEVYFSSAFLDTRYNASTVRVIGLQHRAHKRAPRCKFRIDNQSVMVQATVDLIFPYWPGNSLYLAAIYHCDSPVVHFDLTSIQMCSLDDLPCVKIPLNHPKSMGHSSVERKRELAICGKAYAGELDTSRLIEWFEMNRLAGVSSVIVYDNGIRGWANHVIDHYKKIKFVKTVSFPLLGLLHDHATKHFQKLSKEEYFSIAQQVYLASLNDCIYRFLHRYQFFLIIDYDELLLPYRDESIYFMALRHSIHRPTLSGLTFYTAWHFSDFEPTATTSTMQNSSTTSNMGSGINSGKGSYILEHNRRTNIINNQPKSVVMAAPVLSVNWHGVIRSHPRSKTGLNGLILPTTDSAYVHHYRGRCVEKFLMTDCNVMLRQADVDVVVPRYGHRLQTRVKDVYKVLGMRSPHRSLG